MREGRTALVLSAGGMFGAYQAGVYRALAGAVNPDLVVGASVGALNGWVIASGCSADVLVEQWLHPDRASTLKLCPNAGWRNGWFDPEPLKRQTERLVAEFRPKVPFGLVMVQVPRLRTVRVEYPDVTAAHLQASCSIPLFLPAVKIGKRRYVDGGFLEKLPIRGAVAMGATRIIAVDSLPNVGPWWLRIGVKVVRLFGPGRRLPEGVEVMVISPSEYMGSVQDGVFWEPEKAARWIALGEKDGANFLGRLGSAVQADRRSDGSPASSGGGGTRQEG